MEAGTSTMNPPCHPGPSAAHGASCGGSAPVMPEEQSQHKPFFYVQPQPFLPVQSLPVQSLPVQSLPVQSLPSLQGLQWPLPMMPLNYSPYYGGGFPGFGYGLPLMPHFQPSPFMEAPGFVVPHTHLHLMDYRRMLNPQYYQSMAYHARRLRYQQHIHPRDVTSSEVQTEPLPASQRSSNQSEAPNEPPSLPRAASEQKDDPTMALNELAPSSANATPQKASFVIEAEEVRIQCCATPAGLQVLHSNETSEMFAQDVVHCSSIVQNSLLPEENPQIVNAEGNSQQPRQACPDILIVATPSGSDKNLHAETTPTRHSRIKMTANVDTIRNDQDLKVMRLPFDANYLDELRKIESTVWSTEDTLVPSPNFIIESCDETLLGEVPSAETLAKREETAQEVAVPIVHVPKLIVEDLEDVVPALGNPMFKTTLREVPKQGSKMDVRCLRNLLLSDDSQIDIALPDTSFESLPAYLPSTSWLADFENASYCKMPLTPQKLGKQMGNRSLDVPARRRKLDAEFKEAIAIRKPKERYKTMGRVDRRSLSDHECCVSRSCNEKAFVPFAGKAQRLCVNCSGKQKVHKPPANPAQVSKRKSAPFQPRNDFILPTCEACKGHVGKRFAKKGSSPDVRVETEGESSENSGRRRLMEEMKRPLAVKRNVEKCPGTYPKLRERNCLCGELQQPQLPSKWQRIYHCPHGNAIRETDENRSSRSPDPWRIREPLYPTQRWQTDKLWKTAPGHNMESLKNDLIRAQHTNLHKKSLPPPQGIHRKDTWC